MRTKKVKATLNLEKDVLTEIDIKRGDVNRSLFVNKILRQFLKGGEK